VSGQQHGLVCLGADDRPVRAAKLWNDTTTVAESEWLTGAVGGVERALDLTGNAFLVGYTAPKVVWLARHEPDLYAATRRMCLPHDYLNLWLTGAFATEPGDASGTAYFDVRAREYSQPVLAAMDSSRDWTNTLPAVAPSLSVVGSLRPAAAEALGLSAGIPVSGGGGDNMMAAIGVGAVREGPVVVSLGTSGTAFAYRSEASVDLQGEAAAFCDSTGAWLPLVCTLNCTVATDWIASLFGLDHAGIEAALAASPPGARGLTFLPHLGGERTPNAPTGTGVFAGLHADHASVDLVRAVVEGVTFGLQYALGALERTGVRPTHLTLVGGGAASDSWAQLCADVFQVPVVRPTQTEAAAVGGARQVRWAVDKLAVQTSQDAGGVRFEPRLDQALEHASRRADHHRQVALQNAL
jgi:xylulokinase